MELLNLTEGDYLVKLARKTLDSYVNTGKTEKPSNPPERLKEPRGVFVTLQLYPECELRGCIGFPVPAGPLADSVVECTVSSASRDPRFESVEKHELGELTVEVSVLTKPELVEASSPSDYPNKIKVGRDGLLLEFGPFSGLLLPQVPIEWKWNEREFLSHTCRKAGLPQDFWLTGSAKIFSFRAQIFAETEPGGKVIEKKLGV